MADENKVETEQVAEPVVAGTMSVKVRSQVAAEKAHDKGADVEPLEPEQEVAEGEVLDAPQAEAATETDDEPVLDEGEQEPAPPVIDEESARRIKLANEFEDRYRNSKKFRLSVIEDYVERGVELSPDQRREWDEHTAPKPAKEPAKQEKTPAQLRDDIDNACASMEEQLKTDGVVTAPWNGAKITGLIGLMTWRDKAIAKFITEPAQEASKYTEETRQKTERQKTQDTEIQKAVKAQGESAAKTFKKIMAKDDTLPYGYRITDKAVMAELCGDELGKDGFGRPVYEFPYRHMPLEKQLKTALRALGRWKEAPKKSAGSKEGIPRLANVQAEKPKKEPELGTVRIPVRTRVG